MTVPAPSASSLSLDEAEAHLSEVVSRVAAHHERVLVTVHGTPSAGLIAPDDPDELEETIAVLSAGDHPDRPPAADRCGARGCGLRRLRARRRPATSQPPPGRRASAGTPAGPPQRPPRHVPRHLPHRRAAAHGHGARRHRALSSRTHGVGGRGGVGIASPGGGWPCVDSYQTA